MDATQAFELDLASLIERDVPGALDEGLEEGGNEYLPAAGLRGDARGDDDVLAEEVLFAFGRLLFDRLPRMEAHPYADRLLGALVPFGEGELDRDGAVEPLTRGLECDHEAVALVLDLEAAVLGELGADDGVVVADDLHELLVAEAVGHLRGPFDVAEHDGHGAVRRGVGAEVWLLLPDDASDCVERGVDIAGGNALELQLEAHGVLEWRLHLHVAELADGDVQVVRRLGLLVGEVLEEQAG